jgi:hypothetical protein
VRYGYTTFYSGTASNSGNYVFGMEVNVPVPITVTALAAITNGAGGTFAMGLYSNGGSGVPTGNLITSSAATNSVGGNQELPVAPAYIAAGNYWVCASASSAGIDHWGYAAMGQDFAAPYTYTGAMPATAPAGSTYPNDTLNFYLVGYE